MKFTDSRAEIFIPDCKPEIDALKRTTHMAFGAHQDDIEILGFHGILECMNSQEKWFTGITLTDGSGSPRSGRYAEFSNEQMQEVRWQEQRNAAAIGRYSSVIQLKHSSTAAKTPGSSLILNDLRSVFEVMTPSVIYTHNLADKHDTHIGTVLKLITILRELPSAKKPKKVYGVEIWRDLDWLPDDSKVVLDVSGADHIAAAILGVYDSQIAGGKRYDLATTGRWRANATYLESHGVDKTEMVSFAMDLTPLIENSHLDIINYTEEFVNRFKNNVTAKLSKYTG